MRTVQVKYASADSVVDFNKINNDESTMNTKKDTYLSVFFGGREETSLNR